ncbi:hypothetical protein QWY86_13485 [Pedobacter aquatilis]|uniref:hypothetical protein n=1 Tax=Pedobacter aquatilis TaxID=351343 RepID=UPI0025B38E77|nr:hypothetical protein [Pedobacter aquatilis]MDN3587689.1 hypothetical protein [Pedobacter aquatilis]
MDSSITSIFFSLVSLISPLFVFIASCYYISKNTKVDAILLFIGSGVALILNIFYSVVMPYLVQNSGMPVSEVTQYYTALGVVSFIAGLCFATGLFLLIYNTVKSNKTADNQFPTNQH